MWNGSPVQMETDFFSAQPRQMCHSIVSPL